jgi:hypothetical protein
VDYVWTLVVLAVLVAMAWLAYRIEPHWVSRDGQRFLCMGQQLNNLHTPVGRWSEVRVAALPDGALLVDQRRRVGRTKPSARVWNVVSRMPEPPRKNLVAYLLRGRNVDGAHVQMLLRLPAKSKAVALLDAVSTQ